MRLPVPHSPDEVLERADHLYQLNQPTFAERERLRLIMDGGPAGIKALLGTDKRLPNDDMPVVHLMDSGLRKFAQKLRHVPDLRIDPRADRDSEREKRRVERRERIVRGYDQGDRLPMQLPQVGRWLPGYGLFAWIIKERRDALGRPYPTTELRDSYDLLPDTFGPNQQPESLAIRRNVNPLVLARQYPVFAEAWAKQKSAVGQGLLGESRWESVVRTGIEIIEYYDNTGRYLLCREPKLVLDYVPTFLNEAPFVVGKRFAFSRPMSHYQHVIGLMAMLAKFNMYAEIVTQDSTFRETNVFGQMISSKYKRGRFAINEFEAGARVEKPMGDINYQTFQHIDRIERQLRIGGSYPVTDDSQSPLSFATGEGLDRITESRNDEISEYQLVIRDAVERRDSLMLEWDEKMYPGVRKPAIANTGNGAVVEEYVPSRDIDGNYLTRRVFGVMATWDDATKIVGGLQLLGAGVIDLETLRENLSGLDNITQIGDRLTRDQVEAHLIETIKAMAAPTPEAPQGDPRAILALVEIYKKPSDLATILDKFFTPEEPQMSPEEEMFLEQQQQGAAGGGPFADLFAGGANPAISTVLSRLEQGGATEGGVQTVSNL